jgi:hypothetical protein
MSEYRMENGDKIFARGYFLDHQRPDSNRLKNLTELDITVWHWQIPRHSRHRARGNNFGLQGLQPEPHRV